MNTTNSTVGDRRREMVLWVWIIRAVIAVLTVLGNGLVMILMLRSRRLRVIQNTFIFSLALADFLVGAVITPTDLVCSYWYPTSCEWPTLRTTYDILLHLSVTNLCALTFDRYMAVVEPLQYHSVLSRRHIVIILVVSLFAAAVLPIIGHICLANSYNLSAKIFRVVDMTFLQIVPPILLAIAYVRMVYIARQHEKTVKLQQNQLSFNYGNSSFVKKRRSRQGESRERASVKMIGAVIIAFLLCYVLAIVRSLVFYILHIDVPKTVTHVSRILLLTNSAVNFLVYAFLKKDFRHELKRIVCKQTRIPKESSTFHDLLT
ncbi:trace amine-associated receptor 13c-like [Exaiptasia diaphana]|uniref:G-protein coupled receptors family 1 profile domain-containing protein n=1 Tax=Exaiptasia diaphana TaxID=2652724 RepID=A0A913WQX8_EXADI|nr:trace amine-associated receptor 13c-like [Exaiptasia diaphana]